VNPISDLINFRTFSSTDVIPTLLNLLSSTNLSVS